MGEPSRDFPESLTSSDKVLLKIKCGNKTQNESWQGISKQYIKF